MVRGKRNHLGLGQFRQKAPFNYRKEISVELQPVLSTFPNCAPADPNRIKKLHSTERLHNSLLV